MQYNKTKLKRARWWTLSLDCKYEIIEQKHFAHVRSFLLFLIVQKATFLV